MGAFCEKKEQLNSFRYNSYFMITKLFMTRSLSFFITICLALLSSCTSFYNIEKRKYRDGFYVDHFSISNKLIGLGVRQRRDKNPLDRATFLPIPLKEVNNSLLHQDLVMCNNSIPIHTNKVEQIDRNTVQHKNANDTLLRDSIPKTKHGNKVLTKDQAAAKAKSSADWGHDFLIYGIFLPPLLIVSIILLFRARVILRKNDIDDETLKRRTRRLLLLNFLILIFYFLLVTGYF